MLTRFSYLFFIISVLSGCITPPPPPPPAALIAFPEQEYAVLPKDGTSIVRGQAFLRTRGGDIKTAAGNIVIAIPATTYTLDWLKKRKVSVNSAKELDQRAVATFRETIADGSGHFQFLNLPAGGYFLLTTVTWETPTGYEGSMEMQGGSIVAGIRIGDGLTYEKIITDAVN